MESIFPTPELPVKRSRGKARDLHSGLTVLRTESKGDQAKLLADICDFIGPTNPIERVHVRDWVYHEWHVRRYERIATGLLNNALKKALKQVLSEILLPAPRTSLRTLQKWWTIEDTSYQWLFDKEVKRRVSSVLREAGIDESAIEAMAFTLVAEQLKAVDLLRKSAETARDRALRSIAKLRKSLAKKLQRYSDRTLAADQVPSIANDEN